jgi:hypothetical protein
MKWSSTRPARPATGQFGRFGRVILHFNVYTVRFKGPSHPLYEAGFRDSREPFDLPV